MAPKRVRSPVSATEKTRRLFRFQGKSIFLTYAQTYFTADYLLVELRRLCNDRSRLRYIRVATEQHRDGNTHFHVLIQLHKKLDTKDVNLFDIPKDPSVGPPIHPNWQLPRRDSDVFAYISKHGDYIEEGELNPLQRSPKKHRDDIWESIITSSNSATEFLELTLQMQPFHAANNWERLKAFAADRWPKPPQQYEAKFHTFGNLPEPLQRWLRQSTRPKSLILEGPSRTGKTEWARSIGRHNYFCGHIDLGEYDIHAQYNVIDDIQLRYCKYMKELIGAQHDWTANPKYKKPITIKGGIPSIVICNPDMSWDSEIQYPLREWFNVNADFYTITEPLF
ncbi:TPA_asm: Rep [Welwitschia mirabilis associated geminivirus A]|uniref:Replication-associated protein n=1 Tax=Welwitschia mirabilis associated geminivirus A TaxID=2919572 RepID=A0A9N7ABF5_9GEMI|nr:TPA_asm: Rep [Welwitschia mirabilis associated geminivirus A]